MTLNAPSVLEMTLRNLATKETLLRRTMDLSADDERAGLAGNPALQRRAESCPHYPVRGPGTGPEQGRAALVAACLSILAAMPNLRRKLGF